MSEPRTYGGANPRGPLRRDRRSKAVAGVCGGLGRHLGTDPVIFRILFVVFSFVGGLGLLAYAAAWLFVPQEGAEQSEAHRMLTGNNPWMAALMAVGLGLGVIAAVSALSNGLSGMWPMWLIAGAVFAVLLWRGDIKLGRYVTFGLPQRPPTWWQQPVAEAEEGAEAEREQTQGPDEAAEESAEPRDEVPPHYAAYTAAAPSFGTGPDVGLAEAENTRPVRSRRRGYGGLVLASLLAVSGSLGVLNAAGVISLNWLSGGALVLLLLGAGMVIGGLFGKTTGLVPIGLVLAIPLILLTAVGVPLHGTVGDADWAPASAADVRALYQIGIGDGSLDLSHAAPGAGRTLQVKAQIGIGDLDVVLPPSVDVRVQAHDGVGSLDAAGETVNTGDTVNTSRWNVNESFDMPTRAAHPQGTIVLVIDVGCGDVNVEEGQ
ncbi:PspC domain-containing protein [Actinospica robiniae]|uniref:PspC domain-containing protein n=1 Tax=Actinospica robiniae TaxID=304901 RepID=UPI000416ECA9|nr:PspC domain-containing protein [Actinospica robiniae]